MQKNFFAITGRFSPVRLASQAAVAAWFGLYPLAALLPVSAPWLRGLVLAALLVQVVATVVAGRWAARPLVPSFLPCVGLILTSAVMLRAAFVGWRKGGIEWRGVLYPTSLLQDRQRVRF
jgi:hypothetical protein